MNPRSGHYCTLSNCFSPLSEKESWKKIIYYMYKRRPVFKMHLVSLKESKDKDIKVVCLVQWRIGTAFCKDFTVVHYPFSTVRQGINMLE